MSVGNHENRTTSGNLGQKRPRVVTWEIRRGHKPVSLVLETICTSKINGSRRLKLDWRRTEDNRRVPRWNGIPTFSPPWLWSLFDTSHPVSSYLRQEPRDTLEGKNSLDIGLTLRKVGILRFNEVSDLRTQEFDHFGPGNEGLVNKERDGQGQETPVYNLHLFGRSDRSEDPPQVKTIKRVTDPSRPEGRVRTKGKSTYWLSLQSKIPWLSSFIQTTRIFSLRSLLSNHRSVPLLFRTIITRYLYKHPCTFPGLLCHCYLI